MQNGPSIDQVGIWIKSKRGQRLGNRAISDLEESRPRCTPHFRFSVRIRNVALSSLPIVIVVAGVVGFCNGSPKRQAPRASLFM
ncbi:hypothetical protein ACS0PU_011450 [Formica fusca]